MKVEKTKPKRNISELPHGCKELIDKLHKCPENELVLELRKVNTWSFGKCELYHWVEVLNRFDGILAHATEAPASEECEYLYMCPKLADKKLKEMVISVLHFTALLIEHSYARHIYNSMEHLNCLLSSTDLDVVIAVLNLIYVFSKRSNFLSRVTNKQKLKLNTFLETLGESWGGKENGLSLASCCEANGHQLPATATSVYFELTAMPKGSAFTKQWGNSSSSSVQPLWLKDIDKDPSSLGDIMQQLNAQYAIGSNKQHQWITLIVKIRLAKYFSDYRLRLKCIQARLQAISILVYSGATTDVVDPLLYSGFVEELVEVLEMKQPNLHEVKASCLRALTAMIHLERDPRLGAIIEATGASTYHGFLPSLVRECITSLTDANAQTYPQTFATALFSFLYHLATYEASGDALVSSGIMESLLQVVDWQSPDPSCITFVTRAVRVIDLITNIDMTAFHSLGGWNKLLWRLKYEVDCCKEELPFILPSEVVPVQQPQQPHEATAQPQSSSDGVDDASGEAKQMSSTDQAIDDTAEVTTGEQTSTTDISLDPAPTSDVQEDIVEPMELDHHPATSVTTTIIPTELQCLPQRAALIKSILNFFKKAIPDPTFAENIRNLVDSSLPDSLKHIVSNAEYYGPSIYLPATEVMTVFVFHEPSQLSALQDNGLPGVVLNSLLMKNIPATREVLSSVPNILSALCLNARGLQTFTDAQPFERLLKVLINPLYLPAMRRRKGTVDQIGDTVCNLGIAMDELMRHQPTLKSSVIAALIELLRQVRLLGLQQAVSVTVSSTASQKVSTEAGCSDEEDDDIDDEVASTTSRKSQAEEGRSVSNKKTAASVPIMEYVLHVVHFLDAILSTNSTDDHIKEYMQQGGLPPLLDLATMLSLPLDFATSNACSAIATACKGILHIGHEPLVMTELFKKLSGLLQAVECFVNSPKCADGSVLLEEVTTCRSVEDVSESYVDTPVLHNLACLNSLLTLCVHLSRTNQIEPRVVIVNQWGSTEGLNILQSLLALYRALLWEGFTLLAIADSYKEETEKQEHIPTEGSTSSDMPLVCDEVMPKPEHSSPSLKHLSPSLKHLTPLVAVTSRVGKSIAELLSLLVRLATGPLHRHHRRSLHTPVVSQPPPKEAVSMCQSITSVLVDGLCWSVPLPRLQPCVLTSSLGQWLFEGMTFTLYLVEMSEFLLFDDRKRPYHLMLMHFDKFNGLSALTECFHKAMSALKNTKNTNIDGSCVDFLDGWLNLVEKLLNTQSIVDSPHTIVTASTSAATSRQVTFDAITFVMKAQQCLAPCLLELWDSRLLERFTPHVVELLLSCLRYLVTGEQVISNHVEKKGKPSSTAKEGQSSTTVGPLHHGTSTLPVTGRVDAVSLQQLMDMGFTRDHATDALLVCGNNLTAAMEWILTHPPTEDTTTSDGDGLLVSGGLSEEEQMMRAIALSLELGGEADGSSSSNKKEEPVEPKEIIPEPLDSSVLDGFTANLMTNCLKLIDTVPDAAHKLCSLFTAVGRRNGLEWQESAMLQLRDEALIPLCHEVVQVYSDNGRKENTCDARLKSRLHLVALLSEEMPKVCADVFCVPELRQLLIQLLQLVSKDANTFICPLWLIGLLLLMDSIEKVVLYCKWKFSSKDNHDYVWQWFDEIAHRWCGYSTEDSAAMEKAYQAAEPSVKISSGRQRYVVLFGPMLQVNVDTGTRRPVMRTPVHKTKSKESDKNSSSKTETSNKPASKAKEVGSTDDKVKLESVTTSSSQQHSVTAKVQPEQSITGFSLQESLEIIKNCTRLIGCPLDQDTLHAALRLCLRFTRDHLLAEEFVNCGGPQALLAKKRDSSFKGFSSLTILILRHVVECNSTLSQTMENVICSAVTNHRPSLSRELSFSSSGHRELHLVMRRLAPAACRNTKMFKEKSSTILRVNNRPAKIEQHRTGSGHRIPATIVQCTASSQQKTTTPPALPLHVEVINMLIDKLCTLEEGAKVSQAILLDSNQLLYDSSSETVHVQMGNVHVVGNERLSARAVSLTRDTTGNRTQRGQTLRSRPAEDDDDTSEDMNVEYNSSQAASPERKESKDTTSAVNVQQTEFILSKAGLMRLLTELIDSYPNCCQVVSDSIRTIVINGESKQMNFLAFVMEYLLPPDPSATSIPNVSRQSKNFLQYIAMSSVSSAQSVFVHEFKNCFAHALLLPESLVKHNWLRSLANLLSAILDKQNSLSARTAARMLVRKGIITDLARAVHCLDLNSSHLVSTVNTILKPLESLTRFVNQVSAMHHKQSSSDSKATVAAGAELAANNHQAQPPAGEQENTTGEQQQSGDQQVGVADSQPAQNMDSSSLLDGVQSESLVPLEEEPQVEEEEEEEVDEEDTGLLYPAANIVNELVGGLIEEALLDGEQSGSEDNSISDMETASDEESDEPADVEDNCNSAGEEQESDEEESQGIIEEDEQGDSMLLHYGEEDDDEDDDSSSHDHVSHQSEQDDEHSRELSSSSEDDITDIIHEEIDMIPGEVPPSTTAHDEEHEEENEDDDEDEDEEESLDLDDMDAEYDHDFDVYHDPEEYVQVGVPYGGWREVSGGWEHHFAQHSGLFTRYLHAGGGGTYSFVEGGDHLSSSSSTATTSQLPARHPMLAHQDMQQEHSTSLGFATYREANGTTSSHSLTAIDHSENTIPQSSSALAQLLSTSSAHDVLRLNRSALSTPQPSTTTAASAAAAVGATSSHDVASRTDTEDLGNLLTNIPSTYSRWTEECEALDGSIQHLCINSIKPSIIAALEQAYEEDSKRKGESKEDSKSSTSAATTDSTASSSLERTVRNRIASATASVNSAIDNLHASLQSVANTLAGTVEMVRSGLDSAAPVTSVTATNRESGEEQENTAEQQDSSTAGSSTAMNTTVDDSASGPMTSSDNTVATLLESDAQQSAVVESPPPPLLPVSIALPTSSTVAIPSDSSPLTTNTIPAAQTTTSSAPPTSSFDGSQESAAAVLQNTDPADPMYMFLSAVAGAPAPPLTQSSTGTTTTTVAPPQQLEVALRQSSDALRIASHIVDMLQSDTLPLANDDNDDDDDDDDEEDEEGDQDELIGIVDRTTAANVLSTTGTTTSLTTALVTSTLTVSATSSNSTSPCTTLAPQLSTGLQVQTAVTESMSSDNHSEMVGDVIPLQGTPLLYPVITSAVSTTTSNNTAVVVSSTTTAAGDVLSSMPEELDSTFLEALPESIREELVSQHAAEMQRRQLQARQTGNDSADSNFVSTISPEFLAALPPNIQEEVLAQERQQAATVASQVVNQQSQQPTDPSSFLRNLPTSLRRTVLADMDDSILQHLPHEYVTEAQTLRQEHTRQMYEERSAALLEHVINSGGWVSEAAVSGLIPHRHFLSFDPVRAVGWRGRPNMGGASSSSNVQTSKKGEAAKQMLDQEGLACLLLLFFIDQNKLHISRLHRVIKNLCQHPQTRAWMLASILSILQESCCSPSLLPNENNQPHEVHVVAGAAHNTGTFSWLNLSISAALGCHAPVLQFDKTGSASSVTIHPYASSILSNCMLELLIFLARLFPISFLPQQLMPGEHREADKTVISNFWQLLLKLDSMNSKKGKGSSKAFVVKDDSVEQKESELFSSSIVGQLIKMFNYPVIFDSSSLTDKLFRLLALVTASIPKTGFVKKGAQNKNQGKDEDKSQSSDQSKDENKKEGEDQSIVDSHPEASSSSSRQNESEVTPVPDVEVVSKIQYSQEESSVSSEIAVFDTSSSPSVEQQLLKDTIHTLIVGKCSEDGLEDATQFLIQLSRADNSTREIVLSLLLKGVYSLGENVCQQIETLLKQLEENKESYSRQSSVDDEAPTVTATATGAVATSNALTAMVGRNTTDHSHDIHLPAMVPLSCKASQQSFFLRLLKVVCQLRESALNAAISNRSVSSTRNSLLSEEPPDVHSTAPPSVNNAELVVPNRTNSNDQPHGSGDQLQASGDQLQASGDAQQKEEQVVNKPSVSTLQQQQHSPSVIKPLSSLLGLTKLWDTLSQCLCSLADTHDSHAVLVLQPAVEAFFLVHAERSSDTKLPSGSRSSHSISTPRLKDDTNPTSPAAFSDLSPHPSQSEIEQDQYAQLPHDTVLFLKFADTHRVVLNQILRQSTIPLADGPFAMLVNHTKVLDFDVKRRYFRQEMERLEEGSRRNDLVVHVRRDHVFEDSFRELHRRSPEEMKSNLYISFEGEEGQDAGGLLREWYLIISRDIFNPNYALFTTTPGDKTTYMPNSSSHINPDHLNYFKFVGRIIAKAIYDNKLLECYFTRSFYKHILGKHVHYTDMQAEDYSFYQGMVFLLEHDLNEIGAELTFSTEVQQFGLTEIRDLKSNGRNIPVTEENKREYVQLACQMKMTSSIRAQIKSFLEGFYEIIPKKFISIFNEQELELLISGMPTIDIDDLKQNTEYNKYTENSLQIQWFWRAMKSFDQEDRARFLQFVTGTSRVPLQGFVSLEGMNGPQKFQIHRDDRSTERLPCAHTCFNQLDLPPYETYNKLRTQLLLAIRECPEGFGFA